MAHKTTQEYLNGFLNLEPHEFMRGLRYEVGESVESIENATWVISKMLDREETSKDDVKESIRIIREDLNNITRLMDVAVEYDDIKRNGEQEK